MFGVINIMWWELSTPNLQRNDEFASLAFVCYDKCISFKRTNKPIR